MCWIWPEHKCCHHFLQFTIRLVGRDWCSLNTIMLFNKSIRVIKLREDMFSDSRARGGWTVVPWPEGGGVKPGGLKKSSIFSPPQLRTCCIQPSPMTLPHHKHNNTTKEVQRRYRETMTRWAIMPILKKMVCLGFFHISVHTNYQQGAECHQQMWWNMASLSQVPFTSLPFRQFLSRQSHALSTKTPCLGCLVPLFEHVNCKLC